MKSFSYIQGFLTTREAANYLNVTEHRVVELARNGDLDATRLSERVLLVNATSVHRLASIERFAGRPLNPRAAWGMLWMLDGLRASWLSPVQHCRIKNRLSEWDAHRVVWSTRKRARRMTFWANDAFVPDIHDELMLTGRSAVAKNTKDEPDECRCFDLIAQMPSSQLVGYIPESKLKILQSKCCLLPDAAGNIELHVAEWLPYFENMLPRSVVAADLAMSPDPRERQAGLDYIEKRLESFRGQ